MVILLGETIVILLVMLLKLHVPKRLVLAAVKVIPGFEGEEETTERGDCCC